MTKGVMTKTIYPFTCITSGVYTCGITGGEFSFPFEKVMVLSCLPLKYSFRSCISTNSSLHLGRKKSKLPILCVFIQTNSYFMLVAEVTKVIT